MRLHSGRSHHLAEPAQAGLIAVAVVYACPVQSTSIVSAGSLADTLHPAEAESQERFARR
jgi:hypothetical protein